MATSKVDPALLEGEDLERWYRRTPDEIDEDRRIAEQLASEEFAATTRRLAEAGWSPEEASVGPVSGDRDLRWIAEGPNRRRAIDVSSSDPDDERSWQEARATITSPPVLVPVPSGPRVGPSIDSVAPFTPKAGAGFFGRYSPVPNPALGPAYITGLPSPLFVVAPKVGGWFELDDGSRVRSTEVDRIYAEQQRRTLGTDEQYPSPHVRAVDRLRDGQIPSRTQLEENGWERDPTCHPNGGWEVDPQYPHYSERTQRYEAQITRAPGVDYVVRNAGEKPVKFDGCAVWAPRHPLLEAKGPGYAGLVGRTPPWNFVGNMQRKDEGQAQRQSSAAHGRPVQWHVAEEGALPHFRYAAREQPSIDVYHTPAR